MAKATQSLKALPAITKDQLHKFGRDISVARKRRRMSLKEMSERMMVNIKTVQRLEKGDPAVGFWNRSNGAVGVGSAPATRQSACAGNGPDRAARGY